MINTVMISSLFGHFDYTIELKNQKVTILTGPNGYGKSTLLKILESISKGYIFYFFRLDFESLEVVFDNGNHFSLRKEEGGETILINGFYRVTKSGLDIDMLSDNHWIRRVGLHKWVDVRTDEVYGEDELLWRTGAVDDLPFTLLEDEENSDEVKKLIQNVKEWSGEVRLISEQRLIRRERDRRDGRQTVDVISDLPKRLRSEITKVAEEYSAIANKLDGSYPKRLLSAQKGVSDEEEYRSSLKEVNKKFEKLRQYKLVDMDIIKDEQYNAAFATALKVYFDDFAEKYKVFEALIEKLDLFTNIINSRLEFKKIAVSRQNGFQVVDGNGNSNLSLEKLSSGEKQEIVLFYELIFGVDDGLLLLIDEPEISLHISWQQEFLDDLLKICDSSSIHAIVSTHAPEIISNHFDIQIDLGELYAKSRGEK